DEKSEGKAADSDDSQEKPAKADEVKIKYGATNPEVSGVVASSRLLWALGYGADRWYPVHVICHHCSADPKNIPQPANGDAEFDSAALERQVEGKTLESHEDEGWAWPELSQIDAAKGGATRAQVEALELLAVMIQHTDSKPQQQKMVCADGDVLDCRTVFLF